MNKMKNVFKKLGNKILDIVFPINNKCIFCNEEIVDFEIKPYCENCEKEAFNNGNKCVKCDTQIKQGNIICDSCQKHKRSFIKCYCPLNYQNDVRKSIIRFKDDNATYLAKSYAKLIFDYINKDKLWADRFEKTIIYSIRNLNRRRILSFEFNYNSYRLPINEILYVEKVQDNQKCAINMENGEKYEIISTISELKNKLGPSFFQSHKSYLVNVEKIKKINYADNTITFQNNKRLYLLSNRNKKGLREYVANY